MQGRQLRDDNYGVIILTVPGIPVEAKAIFLSVNLVKKQKRKTKKQKTNRCKNSKNLLFYKCFYWCLVV